ncbi:hypothetical protein EVAR_40968_1 [Eumeta japonica]|uniref:Uncharacterized protein n=1 Tax=Eumeta variegata TaxID=151549 RepID=A0A4C1X3U7_EUMVA|nr:hypothetical protein EVAR_40968_1 [Eumeta japonica]
MLPLISVHAFLHKDGRVLDQVRSSYSKGWTLVRLSLQTSSAFRDGSSAATSTGRRRCARNERRRRWRRSERRRRGYFVRERLTLNFIEVRTDVVGRACGALLYWRRHSIWNYISLPVVDGVV